MATFVNLYSGSSGNASVIVSSQGHAVLLDCGVSWQKITRALSDSGISVKQLCGVVITHEHTDHILGLATLLHKTKVAIYASAKTAACLLQKIPDIDERMINTADTFTIHDIQIERFGTYHDAVDPCGYNFFVDGKKISALTDCGFVDLPILNHLSQSDLLYIESNHDVPMLQRGSYPPYLKRRILSKMGHLSNEDCATVISALAAGGLSKIIFAHISEHNNSPLLIQDKMNRALALYGRDTRFWLADASDRPLTVEV